jgi:hypothetical protein
MALSFTDIGITHLFAAARHLAPSEREDFLLDLAARLDPATRVRALARKKYRRWARDNNAGLANAKWVRYDGVALARLIEKGWLAPNSEDHYPPEVVGAAITDLLQHRGPLSNIVAKLV